MLVWWCVVVMVVVVTVSASRLERQAFSCGPGKSCKPLYSCEDFRDILARPNAHTTISVRRALCNDDKRNPMVCCAGAIVVPVTLSTSPAPFTLATPPTGGGTDSQCGAGEYCAPLSSCWAYQILLQDPSPALSRRIREAACNRDPANPKVCCPGSLGPISVIQSSTTTPSTPTTASTFSLLPISGETLLSSKCRPKVARRVFPVTEPIRPVIRGDNVRLQEKVFWMALLGYISKTDPFWGCGGALITEQYVITAAHCVHPTYTGGSTLTAVRLGELNLETEIDCRDDICAPPPQDFTPAEIIMHPDFDSRAQVSDDIALIRLDRKAEMNPYVEPLCLPPAGVALEGLLTGGQAEVAGWGLTETGRTAFILQKATLPFVNKATCNPLYDNLLLPEQICFGGGVQDSCRGDSGGPLVVRDRNPVLVGIVSRGRDSRCGVEGLPAVYTHVVPYRTWITQNLRP